MKAIPTARILNAIRQRDWTIWGALFELVDNSFGEQRGNADHVWIFWNAHKKNRNLIVLDNGRGMQDIADLFVLGKGTAAAVGDIGFYGVGGSEAGLWLSDIERVETLRDGQVARVEVNWEKCIKQEQYPDIDNRWRKATRHTCSEQLLKLGHGTAITLLIRDNFRKILPENLQTHLSRTFAAGLRQGRQIDWVQIDEATGVATTTPLVPWAPGKLEDVIEGTITVRKNLTARVQAGRVDHLSIQNSKLSINYIYRQIKETTEGFGQPIQGACGSVDLSSGWLEHLTTTKDNFREESRDLEFELMEKTAALLQPLVEKLEQNKLEKVFNNVKFNLETRLNTGIATIRRAQRESAGGYGPGPNPTPRQRGPLPPKPDVPVPGDDEPACAVVQIRKATDLDMDGKLCEVILTHNAALAKVNKDHKLIKQALKSEPVNQLLLESHLINALSVAIVKENALVTFGLFSEADANALLEKFNGNAFDVVLYAIRRLTDGIVHEKPQAVA